MLQEGTGCYRKGPGLTGRDRVLQEGMRSYRKGQDVTGSGRLLQEVRGCNSKLPNPSRPLGVPDPAVEHPCTRLACVRFTSSLPRL